MSNVRFTPGARVTYNGGIGAPRVEVVAQMDETLVQIELRGGKRMIVPADSLALPRASRGLSSVARPAGC